MRLLWVTHIRFGEELSQTTELEAASALARRGWQVTYLAPHTADGERTTTSCGHRWVGLDSSNIGGLRSISFSRAAARFLSTQLAQGGFDAVLVEWAVASSGVVSALRRAGVHWLIDDRSPPVDRGILARLQWLWHRGAWNRSVKHATAFSVITPVLDEFIRRRHSPPKPMVIWPSGVDPSRFTPASPPSDGPVRLVYCGSLARLRCVDLLAEVCELLLSRDLEVELLIFGGGERLDALNRAASSRPWMEVLGPQPRELVPDLLAGCHIGLLPLPDLQRWRFSSPLKLFEYAAAGLPVAATEIAAHSALGDRSWLALCDPSRLVESMADAVESLLTGSDWADLSREARKDAREEFTWDHSVGGLHDELLEIATLNGWREGQSGDSEESG